MTLGILVIYRLIANIPVPGFNAEVLQAFRNNQSAAGDLLSILNVLSGGTLSNFSILAMGVYPYITASIILQLLGPIIPAIEEKMKNNPREGRQWSLAVAFNLLLLGFFKYANFLIANLNVFFDIGIQAINLPLPIGISFYTFQAMSYLIDLYRGEVKLQKNLINFGTYVSMFPQLIAGPIVKLRDVEPFINPLSRSHSRENFAYGVRRFIIGLGKKVILANGSGIIWTH